VKIVENWQAKAMHKMTWVLVAGTGAYHLPDAVLWASQKLGEQLGRLGFGLVVGGWSRVDYVVSKAFAKELENKAVPLRDFLLQIVPERSQPQFPGGRIVYVPPGTLEFTESVKYCDAVVLIGGLGGTYGTFQIARQEQKPIFPIPGTGGDARQAFDDILRDWPVPLPEAIAEQEFAELDRAIHSPLEAVAIVNELVDLISAATATPSPTVTDPGTVFISYSHKDKKWMDRLTEKLRPLEQRGDLAIWADQAIKPAQKWLDEIQFAINKARAAILMVSPNSVNSDFIATTELNWLFEAVDKRGLELLWFVHSPCEYGRFKLPAIQAVFDPKQPLDNLSPAEQNIASVKICKALKSSLKRTTSR
jgi:hypothetical protein